jgi:hypothetical protein
VVTKQEKAPVKKENTHSEWNFPTIIIIFPGGENDQVTQKMVQENLNTGNRSVMNRNHETGISSVQMTEIDEPLEAPMKLGPVITNICISLLVVALLSVCFHI